MKSSSLRYQSNDFLKTLITVRNEMGRYCLKFENGVARKRKKYSVLVLSIPITIIVIFTDPNPKTNCCGTQTIITVIIYNMTVNV